MPLLEKETAGLARESAPASVAGNNTIRVIGPGEDHRLELFRSALVYYIWRVYSVRKAYSVSNAND